MFRIILFTVLTLLTLNAGDVDCNLIFKRYTIDPDLKAVKGWKRVCNNDKLENYVASKVTSSDKEELCMCLTSSVDESREIYLVRSSATANPFGGSK